MGREEGGGFRMGNTCIPVADYVKFKNKIKLKKYICGSLVAQLVKNLPAVQDTWVQSLGW